MHSIFILADKRILLLAVLAFILMIQSNTASAQNWSFAIGPGVSTYQGDLESNGIGQPSLALNGEAWYRLTDNWQIKSGLSFYGLKGEDQDTLRLRSFKASNFEVYTSAMYYLKRGFLTPFVYAGIGATTNNPMGDSRFGYWDLKDVQPEGESVDALVGMIPFGVGLEYEITPVLAVVLDLALRYTFTDHLDAISQTEIPVEVLSPNALNYYESLSDGIAARVEENQPMQGGSPNNNDLYGIFSLKVKFTPTAALFGCVEPYKYGKPNRSNKRKRNFSPF